MLGSKGDVFDAFHENISSCSLSSLSQGSDEQGCIRTWISIPWRDLHGQSRGGGRIWIKMKLWQGFVENTVLEAGNNVSWDVAEHPVDSEDAGLSEQKGVRLGKWLPSTCKLNWGVLRVLQYHESIISRGKSYFIKKHIWRTLEIWSTG